MSEHPEPQQQDSSHDVTWLVIIYFLVGFMLGCLMTGFIAW